VGDAGARGALVLAGRHVVVEDPEQRDVRRDEGVAEVRLRVDQHGAEVGRGVDALVDAEVQVQGPHHGEVLGAVDLAHRGDVDRHGEGLAHEVRHALAGAQRVGVGPAVGEDQEPLTARRRRGARALEDGAEAVDGARPPGRLGGDLALRRGFHGRTW